MSEPYRKDYIKNVYQPFSKFNPVPQKIYSSKKTVETFVAPIAMDPETGFLYDQRPGWYGQPVKTLDQGMADYIFQNLY